MSLRPFVIQCLDHEEGSGARWFDLLNSQHGFAHGCRAYETREQAREHLKRIRATDEEDCMYSYRIVEVNSAAYYAQPTDALEY